MSSELPVLNHCNVAWDIIEEMLCGKNQPPVSRHFQTANNIQQAIKWNLGNNFYSYPLYLLKSANFKISASFSGIQGCGITWKHFSRKSVLKFYNSIFYDPAPNLYHRHFYISFFLTAVAFYTYFQKRNLTISGSSKQHYTVTVYRFLFFKLYI